MAIESENICCPVCQALIGPVKEMPITAADALGERRTQCPKCDAEFAVWIAPDGSGFRIRRLDSRPGAQLQAVGPPFLITLVTESSEAVTSVELPGSVLVPPAVVVRDFQPYVNSRLLNGVDPLTYVKVSGYDLDDDSYHSGLTPGTDDSRLTEGLSRVARERLAEGDDVRDASKARGFRPRPRPWYVSQAPNGVDVRVGEHGRVFADALDYRDFLRRLLDAGFGAFGEVALTENSLHRGTRSASLDPLDRLNLIYPDLIQVLREGSWAVDDADERVKSLGPGAKSGRPNDDVSGTTSRYLGKVRVIARDAHQAMIWLDSKQARSWGLDHHNCVRVASFDHVRGLDRNRTLFVAIHNDRELIRRLIEFGYGNIALITDPRAWEQVMTEPIEGWFLGKGA